MINNKYKLLLITCAGLLLINQSVFRQFGSFNQFTGPFPSLTGVVLIASAIRLYKVQISHQTSGMISLIISILYEFLQLILPEYRFSLVDVIACFIGLAVWLLIGKLYLKSI